MTHIPNKKLGECELIVNALYSNCDNIYLYRKVKPFNRGMSKEIVVHIPIPLNETVSWGVEKKQHISVVSKHSEKYADRLEVNPCEFESQKDFIIHCLQKAIETIFF